MKYALLFPGQGSQEVGMLADLAATDPRIESTFREASGVLGWDLWKLVREGPKESLDRTQRTQPALLAAGIAVWRAWRAAEPPMPAALAGHSLGEYTALVAAGSIDFGTALKLVELRGELMQGAVPAGEGAMAAVLGLDDEAVAKVCAAYPGPGVLEPANFNSAGQVVVAGSRAAIDWLQSKGKELGVRKVQPLAVSVPSHCSLMRPAAEKLALRLQEIEIRPPVLPVMHNVDARPRTEPDAIRQALIGQLHSPVRWSQCVQALAQAGASAYFECGPGKVLTGLNKRILDGGTFVSLGSPDGMREALAAAVRQEQA
ncbi:MAG: ACP S-malonyltransferase [Nevskia sp.]|nr:ACP S-malonyltransferase [Nevskia sp.]